MSRLRPLTAREKELVNWASYGLSYTMIAKEMGITYGTVAASANNIRRKLQIDRNVTLKMAIKAGLNV